MSFPGKDIRVLYPTCARVTAGLILLSLHDIFQNEVDLLTDSSELPIYISFKPVQEIFPAIHIWENIMITIICSAGHNDRNQTVGNGAVRSIFKAIPAALVIRKNFNITNKIEEINCDLSSTLERVTNHFNNDWFDQGEDREDKIEQWSLGNNGEFIIRTSPRIS